MTIHPLSVPRLQARHIAELGLAGAFIWSVELDDFRGTCGDGPYPLLTTIARVLREPVTTKSAAPRRAPPARHIPEYRSPDVSAEAPPGRQDRFRGAARYGKEGREAPGSSTTHREQQVTAAENGRGAERERKRGREGARSDDWREGRAADAARQPTSDRYDTARSRYTAADAPRPKYTAADTPRPKYTAADTTRPKSTAARIQPTDAQSWQYNRSGNDEMYRLR